MKRIRQIFEHETDREASYEPLEGGSERPDGERIEGSDDAFSWTVYGVFLLLGVAMLWAWYDICCFRRMHLLTSSQEHVPSCKPVLPATLRAPR